MWLDTSFMCRCFYERNFCIFVDFELASTHNENCSSSNIPAWVKWNTEKQLIITCKRNGVGHQIFIKPNDVLSKHKSL